ncbi:polysaccharide deacetylase family protein [Actinomadura algeriensis]|uniref:Peptidoglycan/xylan/chitin deacetylase (PgdA/CDA1 family) n=1 Tax=Actinomadura algeriensis TaxID=1679523 RepID=A0ABR9JK45_9ACTN|nr:polysaccharide deacetylase family protein [Actinomadura algeriensis]MBE1530935.1 peptidoglycan/xylan/chitin deacetylase (PgdA/CDA1 family) [Actinomadura algeriensis]
MTARRHLLELGFGLLAMAVLVPLAWQELVPGRDAPARAAEARDVLTPEMLAPASTANRCARGRVELTFDDGPDLYTPQILEVLRAHEVRAVFYVTGEKAAARPELVRAIAAAGHRVENHSWNHPHLTDLPSARVREQLARTSAAIEDAGAPRPTLFRPPFGSTDATVEAQARALGMRVVRWTIDTHDWRGRHPDEIAATVLTRAEPGAVVLMHDGVARSAATVRSLPTIIRGLRARGFCTALPG